MIVGPALARGYKLHARLLVRALDLRQGLHGRRRRARSPSTARSAPTPSGPTTSPITADDFKFTFDTIMNPKNNVVTRNGYDKIRAFNVISPTEFQMVFEEVFAPYRELWAGTSTAVLPKHVLEGQNFNKVWNNVHLRPEDEEARSAAVRCSCSRSSPTSRPRSSRTRTTGARRRRCRRSCSSRCRDSNSRGQRVPLRRGRHDLPAEPDRFAQEDRSGRRARSTRRRSARSGSTSTCSRRCPASTTSQVRKAIATAMPRQQIVDRVVKDANDDADGARTTRSG